MPKNPFDDDDLHAARDLVDALDARDPSCPEALNDLGRKYQAAFLNSGDAEFLNLALKAHQEAADAAADLGDYGLSCRFLVNVGVVYQRMFQCTEEATNLARSIDTLERARMHIAPQYYGPLLNNLANSIYLQYELNWSPDDLDACIRINEEGIALPDNVSRLKMQSNICNPLLLRFELRGDVNDLISACDRSGMVVAVVDPQDPMRARYLDTAARCLADKARHLGPSKDLQAAVEHSREAVVLASELGDERSTQYAINLGTHLLEWYDSNNDFATLSECISNLQELEDDIGLGSSGYSIYLFTLANAYLKRYEALANRGDLEAAIQLCLESTKHSSGTNPSEVAQSLNCLGNSLLRRFDLSSNEKDIDAAVEAHRRALQALRDDSPHKIDIWNNLCVSLLARSDLRSSGQDLEAAFETAERAVKKSSPLLDGHATSLVTFANTFLKRYERNGEPADLDEAVSRYAEAVKITTPGDRHHSGRLASLSYALQLRYPLSKNAGDIEDAICFASKAVNVAEGSPAAAMSQMSLGGAFLSRATQQTTQIAMEDAQNALRHLEQARKGMPSSAADLGFCLLNIGRAHEMMFDAQGREENRLSAVHTYNSTINLTEASPAVRITAGYRGAILCSQSDLPQAASFARLAVTLFPMVSSRTLGKADQQDNITQWAGFAGYGAAVLLQSGSSEFEALQLLETGRNVVNNHTLQLRAGLSELREMHPKWAKKLETIEMKLSAKQLSPRMGHSGPNEVGLETEGRIRAAKDLEELLATIRSQRELAGFLRPPSEGDLTSTLEDDYSYIVAVNATSLRSDAIVVSRKNISSLPLSRLVHRQVIEQAELFLTTFEQDGPLKRGRTNKTLRSILKWLWDCAVRGIILHLGLEPRSGPTPRIWWMPVGLLSIFPFHAACGYDDRTRNSVLDNAVSLYTPSIQSLMLARRRAKAMPLSPSSSLCISMPKTLGEPDLPYAEVEAKQVKSQLDRISTHTTLTAPTKEQVLDALKRADIAHFCCHGQVDPLDPSASRLLLQDWKRDPLTVSDIAATNLQDARLAYLSACHASSTRVLSLLDEGLHLAGAFQIAGYPQTVGTLWQVNDMRAAEVSQEVYRFMLGTDGVMRLELLAEGLHRSIKALRESTKHVQEHGLDLEVEDQPFIWAPFVCVGL